MDAIRTINITFGNAKRQAERLNDCSNQLQKIRQQIDALRGNLQRDWSGEAANPFWPSATCCRRRSTTPPRTSTGSQG